MKKILSTVCFLIAAIALYSQPLPIVPEPAEVNMPKTKGNFTINKQTQIIVHGIGHENSFFYLGAYLKKNYDVVLFSWMDTPIVKNAIHLRYLSTPKPVQGAYTLTVNADGVYIDGDDAEGVFHGVETFLQLLPPEKGKPFILPFVTIRDYPRFGYRGLMLDVGRNFMPVSFIKKYIDFLAYHKMNYFHWHLTDDQGWRIEIKKYPELTKVGAWRNGTIIGHYPGKGNDNTRTGGFYTQEQLYDIIDYAQKRYVTIIPEIEMPGHASAAIASYPWLSCFPNEKTALPNSMRSAASMNNEGKVVQETWGVHEDVFCAGNDSTFTFIQGVLDEVMKIFPSKYIHIGGDECPKSHWKKCPRCQARMKAEGLKDEHELQSYFIGRIEGYLNKRGHSIIGWDEILEGGLAPNATVMSWRGEAGGITAAKQHHPVIMTPNGSVYFDYAQSRQEDSLVIGGYLPFEKVYAFEPIPKELTAEEGTYILGGQANLWTEYINNPRKAEYMLFPRMSALSEALWSPLSKRNWEHFQYKIPALFEKYKFWDVHYSDSYFDIHSSIRQNASRNGIEWVLEGKKKNKESKFGYQFPDNALKQNIYTAPVPIKYSGTGKAFIIENGKPGEKSISQTFTITKSTGYTVKLTTPPSDTYKGNGGAFGLVNGVQSEKGIESSEWLGWNGKDMEAVIDLSKATSFNKIVVDALDQNGSWIYKPKSVEVWGSVNGIDYTSIGKTTDFIPGKMGAGSFVINTGEKKFRFVKVIATNAGIIPEGNPGAGSPTWLFIDEIQVF